MNEFTVFLALLEKWLSESEKVNNRISDLEQRMEVLDGIGITPDEEGDE
jgi:hypothetical protein